MFKFRQLHPRGVVPVTLVPVLPSDSAPLWSTPFPQPPTLWVAHILSERVHVGVAPVLTKPWRVGGEQAMPKASLCLRCAAWLETPTSASRQGSGGGGAGSHGGAAGEKPLRLAHLRCAWHGRLAKGGSLPALETPSETTSPSGITYVQTFLEITRPHQNVASAIQPN